jgi:hypothetical protein
LANVSKNTRSFFVVQNPVGLFVKPGRRDLSACDKKKKKEKRKQKY